MSALLSENSPVLQVQKLGSECAKLKLKLKYNNQFRKLKYLRPKHELVQMSNIKKNEDCALPNLSSMSYSPT